MTEDGALMFFILGLFILMILMLGSCKTGMMMGFDDGVRAAYEQTATIDTLSNGETVITKKR